MTYTAVTGLAVVVVEEAAEVVAVVVVVVVVAVAAVAVAVAAAAAAFVVVVIAVAAAAATRLARQADERRRAGRDAQNDLVKEVMYGESDGKGRWFFGTEDGLMYLQFCTLCWKVEGAPRKTLKSGRNIMKTQKSGSSRATTGNNIGRNEDDIGHPRNNFAALHTELLRRVQFKEMFPPTISQLSAETFGRSLEPLMRPYRLGQRPRLLSPGVRHSKPQGNKATKRGPDRGRVSGRS